MDNDRQQLVKDGFIVFEGLDGAGTTTQCARLSQRLSRSGIAHRTTHEPTGNTIGLLIKSLLKGKGSVHPGTMAYLFAADRHEHVYGEEQGIMANLQKGTIVLSDRYLFSSLAYQSVESPFHFILSLNDRFPLPGHVFFLETPVEECMDRISGRDEKELYEYAEFQKKVRANYDKSFSWCAQSSCRIHMINGLKKEEEISAEIWTILESTPILKR